MKNHIGGQLKRQLKLINVKSERGQSLVEFAFMVIVLTVLLLGVLDIGRAYFTWMALLDSAGEGAQFGSVNPTKWCVSGDAHFDSDGDGAVDACPTSFTNTNPNTVTYRVLNTATTGTLVDWEAATTLVTIEMSDTTLPIKPGRTITVTVTTKYRVLTPFIGSLVGSQELDLSAESVAYVLAP